MGTKKNLASKNVILATVIATVFLIVAIGSASAIDGCVKIGGNPDDPDDVFTCGETVTESCTLNGNMCCDLVDAPEYGLNVGVDDITIDGNGYKINGTTPGACEGIWEGFDGGYARAGIFSDGNDRVTIKNIEVTNFCNGIHIRGGTISNHVDDITIENCTVYDNGNPAVDSELGEFHGISWWSYIWNSSIENCTVYNTVGKFTGGCDDNAAGLNLKKYCYWNNIANNMLYDNNLSGIFSKKRCRNCTVEYNYVYNNGQVGSAHGGGIIMRCKNTDDWIVRHNTVENNTGPGIFCRSERAIIHNNTVTGSKESLLGWPGAGVYITADAYDTYISSNNSFCENQYGIANWGGHNTTLYNNMICDNAVRDIDNQDGGSASGDCNTCNSTSNYDDDGATGCTFQCGVEEGACVGATQFFTCGDTVTESCTLNGNMSCPAGSPGLIIGADGVTIDGHNHKITGGGDMWGVYNYNDTLETGYDDVIIKNLEVENFWYAIQIRGERQMMGSICLQTVKNNTIDNCTLHDCNEAYGISFWDCVQESTIENCEIYNVTGTLYGSCDDPGAGIHLYGNSSYNTIDNNEIHDCNLAGIFSKMRCKYNYVAYNTVYQNGVDEYNYDSPMCGGIRLECLQTNHWTVEHNKVTDNFGPGIYTRGSLNRIGYNIVSGSKNVSDLENPSTSGWGLGNGFYSCGWGNTLISNTFCDNEVEDISVLDNSPVTGSNNTCNTTKNYDEDGTTGCTYTCPGETDLTITAKYEQWFGDVYNVIYTIMNLGNSTAPKSTTGISIDGVLNKTDPVGLIGPGVSYVKTVGPFTMSGNEDAIKVCADNEHVINEISETNNCLENVFTGVIMPDLVIIEKSEAWVDLVNKTYNVTYTVKNIGNADANESTTAIIIDGTEAKNDTVGILPPQATHTAELGPFTMSDESDTIRVCADNESAVEESNEDNNYLQNTFEHPGVPDLVITKKFEEWVVSAGPYNEYNITYTVKNIGTGDAGTSTTSIIIDGVEKATDTVGTLNEGESYTNTLGPYTMSNESDTIKVCADKNNDVEESNEDNNCTENMFEYSEAGCLAEDGTLFRCGNTVTKNCTFNGDMTCPFTDGLKIGANSITINSNNSVLDGVMCTLDALRSGVHNQGYDDVTIKDLEVKGFCHGMCFYGTGAEGDVYRNTIKHCDIHHNGNASTTAGLFGITMKYVYNSTIRNNTVHHQIAGVDPNPGCEDGGNGMFLYKGNYNNFTYNDVYNNTKGGIFIKMQPMHNNISHNDLWDNGQGGIILRCMMSNYNTIEHNNASNNYGSGTFIGAKENTIRYNTVCDNRDGGLYYQDSVGGHGYGINLGRSDGSFDNYLHDNEICGNDYKDIYVVSGVTGNHGVNNTCDMTYNYDDTGTTGCTYPCAPGVCGDVDGLPGVTTNDGRQIFMYLLYGPGQYPLADPWSADCDGLCDGITTNDGRQIFMNLLYGEEEYPLVCC